MKNYLYIISLEYCPYSQNTKKILEQYNIKNVNNVIDPQKKFDYKTDEISTFPQIYYVRNSLKNKKLIGGNDDFMKIIDLNDNISQNPKKFKEYLDEYMKNSKIDKKLLLKTLYLINQNNKNIIQEGGYDKFKFDQIVESQINIDFLKSILGKAIIIISGGKSDGMLTNYENKMQIYEVLEYTLTRNDSITLKVNMVEWDCHDLYCTMRRKSNFYLNLKQFLSFFKNKNFIQFLVTKDKYKIMSKDKQNLSKLQKDDIIPIYSKYGDYENQYFVSDKEIDDEIKSKQFFYIVSINSVVNLPEKSLYDINSFGFEISQDIETYPINQNKHYQLGEKPIDFFTKMVDYTSDGNWIILQKV